MDFAEDGEDSDRPDFAGGEYFVEDGIQHHFHPQDRIVNIIFLTAFTLFVLK